MKGHCACQATGLSSHAIAQAFGHCTSGGRDHPRDPADLKRCVDYCSEHGISDQALRERMPIVSAEWDVLTADWRQLTASLAEEFPTGSAPKTYARMRTMFGMARR